MKEREAGRWGRTRKTRAEQIDEGKQLPFVSDVT